MRASQPHAPKMTRTEHLEFLQKSFERDFSKDLLASHSPIMKMRQRALAFSWKEQVNVEASTFRWTLLLVSAPYWDEFSPCLDNFNLLPTSLLASKGTIAKMFASVRRNFRVRLAQPHLPRIDQHYSVIIYARSMWASGPPPAPTFTNWPVSPMLLAPLLRTKPPEFPYKTFLFKRENAYSIETWL